MNYLMELVHGVIMAGLLYVGWNGKLTKERLENLSSALDECKKELNELKGKSK